MATIAGRQLEFVIEATDLSSGKPIINNLHYVNNQVAFPTTTKAAWLAAVTPSWLTAIALISDRYQMERFRLRNIDDPLDMYEDAPDATQGGLAEKAIPTSECATIQFKTGFRGRSYNGSVHLWGISDDDVENNQLTAGGVTAVAGLRDAIKGPMVIGPDSWSHAIWSRKLSPAPAYNNQVMTVISSYIINKTMGVMRHRRERTVV